MPRKPIWTEGVLVSQHHFQQQDRYHESVLRDRLQAVSHYDWGITELEIDERGFAQGHFKLKRFAAVWPDGMSVACGEGTGIDGPSPRPLPPDLVKLEVFLGLANEADTGLVASDGAGARRFVRESHIVTDLNSGGSPQELEWARPNLQILFGGERHDGFVTIRIAELRRKENGQFHVLDTRVPPVLSLRAAPFLSSGLRNVLANVTARQQQLSAERRRRQAGNVEFHASEVRKFWLLHTLNGVIPSLNHLLDTARTHPEEAYTTLASLAGQLCSFSADKEPSEVPKFNYLELGTVFEELFAMVNQLLPGGIEQSYTEIALEHRPDGMFIGRIADPKLLPQEFFVAVKANVAEALVRERVPAVLKMAGWNQIYDVVKHARRGVQVDIEWNPTGALPVKPGLCFFRVRREGPYWEDISKSATVALYLPLDGEWAGSVLSLYAVDPARAR